MERQARDFKGVWIPKEIWCSEQLSLIEKVIFVEIQSLDNERGCFASNKYFSEFFGIHPRRIAAHVASLKEKGFITVIVEHQNERTIRVVGKYARVPDSELRRLTADRQALARRMTLRKHHGRYDTNVMGGMTNSS